MPHRCGTPEVGNHKWYLTYTCTKNSTQFICVIVKWLATKSPFYFPSLLLLPRSIGSNWKPPTNHPQGHQIFSKVPIVTFEPANSKAIKHNPTLSDSVFKVTRIIDAKNIRLHSIFWESIWNYKKLSHLCMHVTVAIVVITTYICQYGTGLFLSLYNERVRKELAKIVYFGLNSFFKDWAWNRLWVAVLDSLQRKKQAQKNGCILPSRKGTL